MPTRSNIADNLPRLPRIFARAHIRVGIDKVDKVMRHFRTFGSRGLGGSDLKLAVHRHRIAVDDLTGELPRKGE